MLPPVPVSLALVLDAAVVCEPQSTYFVHLEAGRAGGGPVHLCLLLAVTLSYAHLYAGSFLEVATVYGSYT